MSDEKPATRRIEILFVEDSAADALLAAQILAEYLKSAELVVARDGAAAIAMLSDAAFRPAMIILDLNLTKLSGLEVLERSPKKDIPVVVFSTSYNQGEVNRTLELGAREYIEKPTDPLAYRSALLGVIAKCLVAEKKQDESERIKLLEYAIAHEQEIVVV